MTTLIAYHNDPKLKKALVEEIKKHQKADQIIAGTYGGEEDEKWRGCAVGCSIHSLNALLGKTLSTGDHSVYESEIGVSQTLAYLEDTLFEGMWRSHRADAIAFPAKFAEAIPVGADLSLVPARFMVFILNDTLQNVDEKGYPYVVKKKLESAARSAAIAAESAAWSGAYKKYADHLLKLLKAAPVV